MKFFASFAAVVLLALAVAEAAEHHKHHHGKHHVKHHLKHHSKHHHARAGDSCEWKCFDDKGVEVTGVLPTAEQAWAVDHFSGGKPALYMVYNPSKIFIIYNEEINILMVYSWQYKMIAFCNCANDATLLVSISMGTAYQITVEGVAADMSNREPFNAVQKLFNAMGANTKTFSRPDFSTLPDGFSAVTFMKHHAGLTSSTGITDQKRNKIDPLMNNYLTRVAERMTVDSFIPTFKAHNFIIGMFSSIIGVHRMLKDIVATFLLKDLMKDTSPIDPFYKTLTYGSYFIGGFIDGDLKNATVTDSSITFIGDYDEFSVAIDGNIKNEMTAENAGLVGSSGFEILNKNLRSDYTVMK